MRAEVKKRESSRSRLRLAAVGLEAELSLYIDDAPEKPEAIFGSPRAFIRGDLLHRVGTSYQLPTGAAVYFDTGVIEIATPLIELERGCIARAGRSLVGIDRLRPRRARCVGAAVGPPRAARRVQHALQRVDRPAFATLAPAPCEALLPARLESRSRDC